MDLSDFASMLNILAIANLVFLAAFSLMHVVMAYLFHRYLTRTKPIALPAEYAPKAVVVLCLRGRDPFLRNTLLSLLKQDYPNYSIKVVVDSVNDPSWQTVTEITAQCGDIKLDYQELRQRSKICSLKCSSIVQAVESMADDDEILVLSDADVVPHSSWLSELVAPLSQPDVGVSTGSQWFDPLHGHWGSLIRNVWHAGAIIPTVLYSNPWAGSCAMRIQDVHSTGLLDRWKTTIVDDGPVCEVYRPRKLKIHIVPSLVIVNREECSVAFCFRYIRRMLTWSRIYESTFFLTPLHMFGMVVSILVAISLIVAGLLNGDLPIVTMGTLGAGIFATSILTCYLLVHVAIAKVIGQRGEVLPRMSALRLLALAALFPVAIFIYASVLFPAMFARRVKWREVTYEINGRWDIKLIDDKPYPTAQNDLERASSV